MSNSTALEEVHQAYHHCTRCPLHCERSHLVFGDGDSSTSLLLVGEGPGAEEDRQGKPFVGKAGQLLTKMLEAIQITRDEVFITNIVKCRPPGNRTPTWAEMEVCKEILREQFRVIRPRIVVTLGSAPTRALIDPSARITRIRGQWFERKGVKMMPTFHPAYLLRNPCEKRKAWEDFQALRDVYRQQKK